MPAQNERGQPGKRLPAFQVWSMRLLVAVERADVERVGVNVVRRQLGAMPVEEHIIAAAVLLVGIPCGGAGAAAGSVEVFPGAMPAAEVVVGARVAPAVVVERKTPGVVGCDLFQQEDPVGGMPREGERGSQDGGGGGGQTTVARCLRIVEVQDVAVERITEVLVITALIGGADDGLFTIVTRTVQNLLAAGLAGDKSPEHAHFKIGDAVIVTDHAPG